MGDWRAQRQEIGDEGAGFEVQGSGFEVGTHVVGHFLDVGGDGVKFRADLIQLCLHFSEEPAPRRKEMFTDLDQSTAQKSPCADLASHLAPAILFIRPRLCVCYP